MEVKMISHASVLISNDSTSILTDPWFRGDVFNESWSLLCEPALLPENVQGVSHVWISHEHPDHLHFGTLKAIPAEERAKITLLYQRHLSDRVALALVNLGFRTVVELPLARWVELEDCSIACYSVGTIDSVFAVKTDAATVLNTNDAVFGRMFANWLGRRLGRIDVLLTQFSIASWVGNPSDTDVPARQNVIDRMRLYINAFKPKITLPFASFVYFSHRENRFMNDWINTPDRICEQLESAGTRVQFLYNGDSWSTDRGFLLHDHPLERYRRRFAAIPSLGYRSHPALPADDILSSGRNLVREVRRSFPALVLRRAAPVRFYLTDLREAILLDIASGRVEAIALEEGDCDIALSSQALWYAFKFPWGFATLEVSGRYRRINPRLNKLSFYLCHLWSSELDARNLRQRLAKGRFWSFWWSKRMELLERACEWRRR